MSTSIIASLPIEAQDALAIAYDALKGFLAYSGDPNTPPESLKERAAQAVLLIEALD